MMGFGLIFVLLLVGAVAYAGGWRPHFGQPTGGERMPAGGRSAVDIARERYARGEISRAEFEEIRDALGK